MSPTSRAPGKLLAQRILKEPARFLQARLSPEDTAGLRAAMDRGQRDQHQWILPEQYGLVEAREAIDRSGLVWTFADALHITDAESLRVFAKCFLAQNPRKNLVLLTSKDAPAIELPSHYGSQAIWPAASPEANVDDKELLQHSRRLQPRYERETLVTGPKLQMKLDEAIQYIQTKQQCEQDWGFKKLHSRGHGVTLVFHGESGTGKTMAAEVVAKTLGLPLYQIDLSSVVSKYVGDTQKNLKQIFLAASKVQGILLFDEGDAIFGQRTEVKGSHDRYSNLEVNFLLQELETFDGIVILSTNHEKNMDPAFLRRFTYALNFGRPSRKLRSRIWKVNCPKALPLAKDVDFDYLAKFVLTGGNIRNCVREAAAKAASDGRGAVNQTDFLWSVKREMQKHGLELSREMIGNDTLWREVGTEWEYRHFQRLPS
ncbi:MAG: ATP-binding protein [Bdellovibrionales bacterium]|nr:ATP-binding protein [Bdellovibrionales bacterium]